MHDTQLIELRGRHRLIEELVEAEIEVALPLRDRGIDLIAYCDSVKFAAVPIQMKAASAESFAIARKYERFPGIILAYVWHLADPTKAVTYALTYEDAEKLAGEMGWTKNRSWTKPKKENPGWSTSYIGTKLRELLEPHCMTPAKWREKVVNAAAVQL
jgi:hypothetical protein